MSEFEKLFGQLDEKDRNTFIIAMTKKVNENNEKSTEINTVIERLKKIKEHDEFEYEKLATKINGSYKQMVHKCNADKLLEQINSYKIGSSGASGEVLRLMTRWNNAEGYLCHNCGGRRHMNARGKIDDHLEEYEEWGCTNTRFRCGKSK